MFFGCNNNDCQTLFIYICHLLGVSEISRFSLLPFGCDWLPILPDVIQSSSADSTELLAFLRDVRSNALPLLLCALLSQDQGTVSLPSPMQCREILHICAVFTKARATCPLMGLFCLPPTVLGRIARSLSCELDFHGCITQALFCAISCPACLIVPGGKVGSFCGSDLSKINCLENYRVIGFSSFLPVPNFSPLCEIYALPSCRSSLFLCIKDSSVVAAKSPMHLSEIRAILFCNRNRRYVRRWFCSLDVGPSLRCAKSTTPVNKFISQKALLSSCFSDQAAAEEWNTGSDSLKHWMFGPISVRRWGHDQEHAWKRMVEACRFCNSSIVQKVISDCLPVSLTKPGYYVYALVSPLWSKCYVGACGFNNRRCPLDRLIEHIRQALLWNSKTSRKRCASRRSPLYGAMAAVDPANVIQIVLAVPSSQHLAAAERHFIRKLQPVFNIREMDDSILHLAKSLVAITVDDVVTFGNRLLRQARPHMTASKWACLIADVALTGDRVLAAKLARHARTTCKQAKGLRALPQIVVPCAVPKRVISHVQNLLKCAISKIPGFQRLPQFILQLQVGRACWSKSPMADSIIAPSFPKRLAAAACGCNAVQANKIQGHVCLRNWSVLPSCQGLFKLVGTSSLAYRTFQSVDSVLSSIRLQAVRKLQSAGMPKEAADHVGEACARTLKLPLEQYWASLPERMLLSHLKKAVRPVRKEGFIFVRVDRNPGRVVLLCPILWASLQRTTFLQCHRYCRVQVTPSADDPDYCKTTIASFKAFLYQKCGQRVAIRESSTASRPHGYFTIKQKSILLQAASIVKLRPIISHFLHPCRSILRRVARALSILVSLATHAVCGAKEKHLPIWRMHQGTHHWLTLLAKQTGLTHLVEFDVEDCFLNTPRELVIPALRFWTDFRFTRGRSARYFSISKDSKDEDHVGRPCSAHFWEVSVEMVLAVVEWELEHNACFEVQDESGDLVVLRQDKG